jgi:tetratricopeptide (TPR) repeat protein
LAKVFLSYDRDDLDYARALAAALEKAGHAVWWDLHVRGGTQFSKAIEEALNEADVIVVLWSMRSIDSAWVRDEAAAGRDSAKLVPVRIDGADPPLGFRQFQTIDMSGWKRRRAVPKELRQAIDEIAGGPIPSTSSSRTSPEVSGRRRLTVLAVVASMVVAAAALALLAWRPWSASSSRAIAVTAADSSLTSRDFARDLLTTLGQLQAADSAGLELVGADGRDRASLSFQVAAKSDDQHGGINLVLADERDGSLLWSRAFERGSRTAGDLRQEVSYTAAQVLRCALEAYPRGRAILKGDTLRLYLNGCADFSNDELFAVPDLIPVFRKIVSAAPRFEDGWSKLLMSESQAYVNAPDSKTRAQLTRDVGAARAVNPQMGAAYAAESDMLPAGAWTEKLAITDRGIAANPADTWLRMLHAEVLSAVGRTREAVDDLRLAVRADPLSPRLRGLYVNSLGAAGQSDAAMSELQAAERLWPDSSSLSRDKFQFHFDFGDPHVALQFIRSGELEGGWAHTEGFMKARIDPTPANVEQAINNARGSYQRNPIHLWLYVQVLSTFDRDDDLRNLLMTAPLDQVRSVTYVTFGPWASEFWRDPRSLAYARRVGLIQYWRSSGKWPDFCFETNLPYDCSEEAEKLVQKRTRP